MLKKIFKENGLKYIPKNRKTVSSRINNTNIETLEIPLYTDIDIDFFKNFKNLRVINFDPFFINFIEKEKINSVTIPEGITEIPPGTFKNMFCLEHIEIPTTMQKIEKDEFIDCVNIICIKSQPKFFDFFNKKILTSIILLEGEINIDEDPFNDCENLRTLDLSSFDTKNVTNMSGMFYGCKNLKNINL